MIEAIFILSIIVLLACKRQQRQQLTYYVPQRYYVIRETFVELPNGRIAVHRELECIE